MKLTNRPRMQSTGRRLIMALVAGLLLAACAEDPAPPPQERNRFSAEWESESGLGVSWSGYSNGYTPGEEFDIAVTLSNNGDQIAQGRYCFLLIQPDTDLVLATLLQRDVSMDAGMAMSTSLSLTLPDELDAGVYGLSMPVRIADGDTVDMVAIQVGDGVFQSAPVGQEAMDAALEACPPLQDVGVRLANLAVMELAERLAVNPASITVIQIEGVDFPDASLGVPEAGMDYAQVITPGYIITLGEADRAYTYHGAGERVVAVPDEPAAPDRDLTITGVQVDPEVGVTLRGVSSLPDDTCLGSELWADGEPQTWWPGSDCIAVQGGAWSYTVPLGAGDSPEALDVEAQYMLRVFQQGGPDVVAVFAFDLSAPPQSGSGDR